VPRKLHVLLVEDSPDDADLVVMALARAGIDLEWRRVERESEFTAALATRAWDVILSDFAMPAFDGLRAFELARASSCDPPFIFVSGAIGEARAVEAMRAGARDYVMKGDLGRLAAAVRREVQAAENRRRTRAAESALARSEARQRLVFAATSTPLLCVDLSGIAPLIAAIDTPSPTSREWLAARDALAIVEANPAALELFGGVDPVAITAAVRGLLPHLLAALRLAATARDRRHVEFECQVATRRGVREVIVGTRVPSTDEWRDVVLSVFDVTERRTLEARLQTAERLEAIGRLAGGIAHDFNNLLTVVGASADLLRDGLASDDPRNEDVDVIVHTVARASALTKQLLAFSRRRPVEPVLLDLNATIRDTTALLRRVIKEDVELSLCLEPRLAPVLADPTHVEQLIMNLCTNARDAMPKGGTLRLATSGLEVAPAEVVEDPPVPAGAYVMLEVADTGAGMDEATRAKIFEPFFSSKAVGCGAGLGLATVDAVVSQSHGHVRVVSALGSGTTFRVYFPSQQGIPEVPSPPTFTRRGLPGRATILLVEDEHLLRVALRRQLERAGFAVLDAGRAEDALRHLAAHEAPIDVLVTDVVLPGMNGRDLAREVVLRRPETRVLFISGYNEIIVSDQGRGSHSLLEKPFSAAALMERIAEILAAG